MLDFERENKSETSSLSGNFSDSVPLPSSLLEHDGETLTTSNRTESEHTQQDKHQTCSENHWRLCYRPTCSHDKNVCDQELCMMSAAAENQLFSSLRSDSVYSPQQTNEENLCQTANSESLPSVHLDSGYITQRSRTCKVNGRFVVCASTDGTISILCSNSGNILGSIRLPGEVFSSPVVIGDQLVVGCRDDFVYCYKLSVT
jgi:hypothetical protein